jgi:hypothetical protein
VSFFCSFAGPLSNRNNQTSGDAAHDWMPADGHTWGLVQVRTAALRFAFFICTTSQFNLIQWFVCTILHQIDSSIEACRLGSHADPDFSRPHPHANETFCEATSSENCRRLKAAVRRNVTFCLRTIS